VNYFILQPAKFRLDGGAMFGIIPKPLWEKGAPADQLNRIDLALRCLLIQSNNRLILIDTGIGDYHSDQFMSRFDVRGPKDPMALALKEIGLTLADITDVVLSHMHFDHAGGLTYRDSSGTPQCNFPNATLHIHKTHYQYGLKSNARDQGSFLFAEYKSVIDSYHAAGKVHWLEGEANKIMDLENEELRFVCSHGHTHFMMHPFDSKFIYLADIIPTSCHIPIPWVMGYDMNPGISTENKQRLLSFVEERKMTIIFEHDPKYWGATITKDAKGNFVAKELFTKEGAGFSVNLN